MQWAYLAEWCIITIYINDQLKPKKKMEKIEEDQSEQIPNGAETFTVESTETCSNNWILTLHGDIYYLFPKLCTVDIIILRFITDIIHLHK